MARGAEVGCRLLPHDTLARSVAKLRYEGDERYEHKRDRGDNESVEQRSAAEVEDSLYRKRRTPNGYSDEQQDHPERIRHESTVLSLH